MIEALNRERAPYWIRAMICKLIKKTKWISIEQLKQEIESKVCVAEEFDDLFNKEINFLKSKDEILISESE